MYKATVNDTQLFEINETTEKVDFDCSLLPDGKYHLLVNNKSFVAELVNIDRREKIVHLKLGDELFHVAVEDSFDALLESMGMDKAQEQKVSEIKSPMPGLVLDILVNVGDAVAKDQSLMVLEAMKMENIIASPSDAVVSHIEVSKQDKVDKNQILIRFE